VVLKSSVIFALVVLSAAPPCVAGVSFVKDIAPILVEQCLECHREEKSKGAYRVDTWEQLNRTGDSGELPLKPSHAAESELFELITTADDADRMPKKADALPAKDVQLIEKWIAEGAKFDGKDPRQSLQSLIPEKAAVPSPEKYPRPLPVTAMALSGDGKLLATSGYHEVLLWDRATGKLSQRLQGLPERVLGLAWAESKDLHRLIVAGGVPGRSGELWIIDPTKDGKRQRLLQSRDCVLCVAVSPDAQRIVAAGADNHVRCFSVLDGKKLWDTEAHADWVLSLAWSPDGKSIATGSRDRTARVLDATKGEIAATFIGHSVAVCSVAFSADGKRVFSGGANGEVRPFDLNGTGVKDTTLRAGRVEVLALDVMGDNPVAGMADGAICFLDTKKRGVSLRLTLNKDRVNALAHFSPAGAAPLLISADHEGKIRVYEVKEKRETLTFIASPGW
jgi:WD40 repeat protein